LIFRILGKWGNKYAKSAARHRFPWGNNGEIMGKQWGKKYRVTSSKKKTNDTYFGTFARCSFLIFFSLN